METLRLGDVVTVSPPVNCPPSWRPLVRELAGRTFQVVGTADLLARSALVLQPWPCSEPFPSYQLAPVECLKLGSHLVSRGLGKEVA